MLAEQPLHRRLRGVHRHVHRGPDHAGAVPDGDGDRPDPGSELLVGQRPAAGPHLGQLAVELPGGAADVGREAGPARDGEGRLELVGGEGGQQDLALGRLHRGEPGADLHAQRDDLGHRDPGDVDDVRAVQLGHRRGLAGGGDELLEVWAGDVPEPQRADVGHAQGQHLRREGERPAGGAHEAELLEGEQQPARGGPGEAGRGGDLGEGHAAVVGVEAGEDVEPPREGLHEVGPGAAPRHVPPSCRAPRVLPQRPSTRSAPPARFDSSS